MSRARTLGALRTLRELDEARAQARLATAERAVQRRRDELHEQESAVHAHQTRTRAALTHTGSHEDAAALQQRELYRRGRAHTLAQLRAALSSARRALREAEAQLSEERARFAASHAGRRAVEREHDRQVKLDVQPVTRD